MSAHVTSMRDALYEAPGPKTRRMVRIGTAISGVLVAGLIALIVRQFYITGQLDPKYWSFFLEGHTWAYLGAGFLGTMEVSATAGVIAIVLGLILVLMRVSGNKVLAGIARVFTEFFRSVPNLLFIYFFFLIIPQYGINLPPFWMITLPVALCASGVLAEVFRSGINAVPKGQTEAALSLGMMPFRVTTRIVLPQAVRIVIPSLITQLVVVVKDTTVAYVVSYPDLLQNARVLISNYDALVSVYFVVAIIYIIINYVIHKLAVASQSRIGSRPKVAS